MKKTALSFALLIVCSFCYAQSEVHNHNDDHTTADADTVAAVDTVKVRLVIDGESVVSVVANKQTIEGGITPYNFDKKYTIEAIDRSTNHRTTLKVEYDGRFFGRLSLADGPNYVDVVLHEKTKDGVVAVDSAQKVFFSHRPSTQTKQAILWIDQFSTAGSVMVDSMAVKLMRQIKEAGFTAIAVEAKGVEGYASYRKNDLSGIPYLSATKNVNHQSLTTPPIDSIDLVQVADTLTADSLVVADFVADSVIVDSLTADSVKVESIPIEPFDLLGALSGAADTMGIKVYAVFNFFTQGNITTRDTEIIDAHPEWESYVLSVGDTTQIVPLRRSIKARDAHDKGNRLQYAYTNPADSAVQRHELAVVREVLGHYAIDGIMINRCRYGGLDADFSELSRSKFTAFLASRGKEMKDFPADILSFDSAGQVVEGTYFNDWIEFRSRTIADFVAQLRDVVDSYKTPERQLELAAYVGGWYDRYFGYGVNWASKNFRYDAHLSFDHPTVYTETYATTSFLDDLDFLAVGVFDQRVERDLALAELLVNGELPIVAALRMPQQKDAAVILHAVESSTAGMLLFDLHRLGELAQIGSLVTESMPQIKPGGKRKK